MKMSLEKILKMLRVNLIQISLTKLNQTAIFLRIPSMAALPESRPQPQKKADASHIIRQTVFQSRLAEKRSMMMTISGSRATVLQLISSECWNRWLRKLPVNSWKMSGSRS